MNTQQVLTVCEKQGVELSCEGQNLKISGPKSEVTDELLTLLKKHKDELIVFLQSIEVVQKMFPHVSIWSVERRGNITLYSGEAAITTKEDSILCPYKSRPREIHPDVCEWHKQEGDQECSGCEHRVLH